MRDESSYVSDWCGEKIIVPIDAPAAISKQEYDARVTRGTPKLSPAKKMAANRHAKTT